MKDYFLDESLKIKNSIDTTQYLSCNLKILLKYNINNLYFNIFI
jgi:hypothetical protein